MKKLFGHTKKPVLPWDDRDYDESEYDGDGADWAPEGGMEYADGGEIGDAEYNEAYEEEDVAYGDSEEYAGEDGVYFDSGEEIEIEEAEEIEDAEESYGDMQDYDDMDADGSDEGLEYVDGEPEFDGIMEYADGEESAEDSVDYLEEPEYADGAEYAEESDGYAEGTEYVDGYDVYAEGVEYGGNYGEYADGAEYMESYDGYAGAEEYADVNEMQYGPAEYADGDDAYGDWDDVYEQGSVNGGKRGFLARIGAAFRNMDAMDRIMAVTGAGVLILAVVTGGVFISSIAARGQIADFANVGTQLDGIAMIGEQGLMAVADAEVARITAATAPVKEVETPVQDSPKEYDEREYDRQVTVNPDFTSIHKDLKIKFTNKKTDKLVANVPFSVMVTGPDGKTFIWSDDDMDGIIYKKDIAPGTYQVVMEALSDARYSDYMISTDARRVEVKEEIAYVKVDVENEVKQETEINVAKEDTKVNEVVVESVLQDTVAWVESKIIGIAYNEVAKSTIADPANLALSKAFLRMSANSAKNPSEESPESSAANSSEESPESSAANPLEESPESSAANPSEESPESSAANPSEESPESSTANPSEESPESSATNPSEESPESSAANPSEESPESSATNPSAENPDPVPGKVTVDSATLTGAIGAKLKAKATASDFAEDGKMSYSISSSDTAVATADIDSAGNISVIGVSAGDATLTVTAKCQVREEGADDITITEATATIHVTITDKLALTLDATSMTVYMDAPMVINATIVNALAKEPTLMAESSDANVATAKADKNAVTITGIAAGSAVVTVKYTEDDQEVKATCAVTVKEHPKNDKVTKLKDLNGNQLYVKENDAYREAVYADYYSADKFYIKGEVKYTGWQTIEGKVYFFTAEGGKVTGEQIIQGAKYNFASDGSLVVGTGEMGIDVSKWNGTIDWNAVKNSGISYVIIRCGYRGSSEGKLIEDSKFESNIKGAAAAGLKVGIYFFSQAVDEVEAVEEASMALALIKNYTISYPVFLDVETSGGRGDNIDKATRTAVCKAFCQTIQNAGYTAGVYSNKTWLETKLDVGELNAYKIWLAQYAAAPTYAGRYDLWQYRSTGSVSGISGNVDINISYLGY